MPQIDELARHETATPERRDQPGGHVGTAPNRSPTLEAVADRLSAAARAETIFGAPVERGTMTVIPVGRARWGLGGGWGGGTSPDGAGSGGGVGGGLIVEPVGFLEVSETGAHFRPILDPLAWARTILVGGLLGLAIARLLGRRGAR